MPDEQKDETQTEAEMLRLMTQEAGGDASTTPSDDVEAAMLQMLTEQGDAVGTQAEGPVQQDMNSILEQEMRNALQEGGPAASPVSPVSAPAAPAFSAPLGVPAENISRLLDVKLTVSIELGRVQIQIKDIIAWTEGSLIELNKIAGEPVDVLINAKLFARGEVVVVAENFGVRLTQMFGSENRAI